MDEDEDDFYGTSPSVQPTTQAESKYNTGPAIEADPVGDSESAEESDSDIDIITEKRATSTKPEPLQPPRSISTKPLQPQAPAAAPSPRADSAKPASRFSQPTSSRPGTDFPAIHRSTLDPNAPTPDYTLQDGTTKLLTDLDFDADLAESTKLWRLPGSDQSDFFNYGFDEFTWTVYCLKQKEMREGIDKQKEESKRFEMMFGGAPGGMGMPMPGGAGASGMMGMGVTEPSPDMMNQMMQQMMATGVDPSQMDFGHFMQQMQQMPAGGMPGNMPGGMQPNMQNNQNMASSGPPQGAPTGPSQGNFGGHGGGRRGRWR